MWKFFNERFSLLSTGATLACCNEMFESWSPAIFMWICILQARVSAAHLMNLTFVDMNPCISDLKLHGENMMEKLSDKILLFGMMAFNGKVRECPKCSKSDKIYIYGAFSSQSHSRCTLQKSKILKILWHKSRFLFMFCKKFIS